MNRIDLKHGDCLDVMKGMQPDSVDAIVTDPPYAIAFMGKEFDTFHAEGMSDGRAFQNAMLPIFTESLRGAKPGAHLLAFGGTRTYHRLACAIEDAGWEIRDCCFWCYGCLDEETQILTQKGWKKRGEIKVGDMVIAFDRTHGKTLSQSVQRVFDYEYDDVAYSIVSPLTDQLVSKNHRVLAVVNGVLDFVYAEFLRENDIVRVPVYCGESHLAEHGVFIGQLELTTARVSATVYKGRMWCVSVPSGAIVARRNGKIFVTGNSGFPKSMDVSKAIDKVKGAERTEIIGIKPGHENFINRNNHPLNDGWDRPWAHDKDAVMRYHSELAPATPEAAAWNGWGTALKPACEPIVVARKPLEGTVAANVLKYGTGAINIDGCRVPTEEAVVIHSPARKTLLDSGHKDIGTWENTKGRFPANLIHDGSDEVLALFPDTGKSSGGGMHTKGVGDNKCGNAYGTFSAGEPTDAVGFGDSGSAARFFYCAKASRSERGEWNDHVTVKPLALMRYLITLVTPPNGTVMDPFMGSGSTGVAAKRLGRGFLGIEKDRHYFDIAKRRIEGGLQEDVNKEEEDSAVKDKNQPMAVGQMELGL